MGCLIKGDEIQLMQAVDLIKIQNIVSGYRREDEFDVNKKDMAYYAYFTLVPAMINNAIREKMTMLLFREKYDDMHFNECRNPIEELAVLTRRFYIDSPEFESKEQFMVSLVNTLREKGYYFRWSAVGREIRIYHHTIEDENNGI